jgi:hypothetical protein
MREALEMKKESPVRHVEYYVTVSVAYPLCQEKTP